MGYADRTRRPPRTLTDVEIAKLLAVTGEHKDGFRDHVILSLALGTGLRIHEIVGLNVGDVSADGRSVRRRIVLRVFKRSAKDASLQHVFLPDASFYKLQRFLAWKRQRAEALDGNAPLFVSREHETLPSGERRPRQLGTRALRAAFARWQAKAGLDIRRPFHALRHSACTAVYRATRDVLIVQRFAGSVDPLKLDERHQWRPRRARLLPLLRQVLEEAHRRVHVRHRSDANPSGENVFCEPLNQDGYYSTATSEVGRTTSPLATHATSFAASTSTCAVDSAGT